MRHRYLILALVFGVSAVFLLAQIAHCQTPGPVSCYRQLSPWRTVCTDGATSWVLAPSGLAATAIEASYRVSPAQDASDWQGPCPPPKPWLFQALGTAQYIGASIDTGQTAWAIGSGDYVEVNWYMRVAAEHPWLLGPAKIVGAWAINKLADSLYDSGHRRWAWIVRIAGPSLQFAVVAINQRTLSRDVRYGGP